MSGGRAPVCGESESWGAELALGLLAGPDRAAGLSHLSACPSCREQVDDLARVADRLLLLAPEAEPPAGFESRVLAAVGSVGAGVKLAGSVASGPRRRAGGLVGAAAALVVAAAIGGGVVAVTSGSTSGGEPTALRTGLAVSPSGRTSCRVVVSGTRPASVLVSLDGYPGTDAEVRVEMETVSGERVPLGPLQVAGGHGLLVRTLDLPAESLHLMRMVDPGGRVIYEATLVDSQTFTAHP